MTWEQLKAITLAKLDITANEGQEQRFNEEIVSRFPYFVNEAISLICSTVKPNYKFYEVTVTEEQLAATGKHDVTVSDSLFVSFADDVNIVENDGTYKVARLSEFRYTGINKLTIYKPGKYSISYKARWFQLDEAGINRGEVTVADYSLAATPDDVVRILPSYVASQCWIIDDPYRASVYKNEFETGLARLEDTHYAVNSTLVIGGDW